MKLILRMCLVLVSVWNVSTAMDTSVCDGVNSPSSGGSDGPKRPPFMVLIGPIGNSQSNAATLMPCMVTDVEEEDGVFPRRKRLVRRKKQMWRGVQLWGYGATYDKKTDNYISGKVYKGDIDKDIVSKSPNISKQEALQRSVDHIQNYDIVLVDKETVQTDLYVFIDPKDSKAKLVYHLMYILQRWEANNRPIWMNVFAMVDALTGEVLKAVQQRISYKIAGDGGNVKTGRYRYGHGRLESQTLKVEREGDVCVMANDQVAVYKFDVPQEVIDYFRLTNETLRPDICFHAAYREGCDISSPTDSTPYSYSQVHDALFLGTQFKIMLENIFGYDSFSLCCPILNLCTHFFEEDNAFYFPLLRCETFYGLGGNVIYDAVSSAIVGHELGHVLLSCSSHLSYELCQPRGMIEAFADLSGIMLKAYLNNFQPDWNYGSEVKQTRLSDFAVRYMANPTQDGISIDCISDFDCDKMDPHHSAGIYNKAFYNLATTSGWTITKVYAVVLRASYLYWTNSTGFNEGLCGIIHAAYDLEYNSEDVRKAFAQVGVFCGCPEGWIARYDMLDSDGFNRTTCFKISDQVATWAEAKTYCDILNARLTYIDTPEKAQWIYSHLNNKSSKKGFWTSGNDLKTENHWVWETSGKPIGFSDWNKGQPRGGTTENCLEIIKQKRSWGWSAEACSQRMAYICEQSCCGATDNQETESNL